MKLHFAFAAQMRITSFDKTHAHIKPRSAAVKLWFNHRFNTTFAGKSMSVKNKYFRLQWLSSDDDNISTVNNVDTFCFVPINTDSSMCCWGVLHRWLLTRRKTAFLEIKMEAKKKKLHKCKQRMGEKRFCRVKIGNVCSGHHSHQSLWSIVSWHAVLTFTYIICHHFTIKKKQIYDFTECHSLKKSCRLLLSVTAFSSFSPFLLTSSVLLCWPGV